MPEPTLIIMAAGIGSRYGGLKQLEELGPAGETFIDYSLFDALRAGFKKAVFVIRPEIEDAFRRRIISRLGNRIETELVFQRLEPLPGGRKAPADRTKPWGTAHAVLICREAVGDAPFAVVNADDYYGPKAFRLLADHLDHARIESGIGDYALVGFRLKNTLSDFGTVSRGFCRIGPDGFLQDIRERLKVKKLNGGAAYSENGKDWIEIDPESVVSTNIWGFTPDLFAKLEAGFTAFLDANIRNPAAEFLLPEEVGKLIRAGAARVTVYRSADRWLGITYPEDKTGVKKALAELTGAGLYPEKLWRSTDY